MSAERTVQTIVTLGTYPPYEDGISTFTADLVKAQRMLFEPGIRFQVAAVDITGIERSRYPKEVRWMVRRDRKADYLSLAENLNKRSDISCIIIQHEYGIFGGVCGDYLLEFLDRIKKPVMLVLHSALSRPSPEMMAVTKRLIPKARSIVVMSRHSRDTLTRLYKVPDKQIVAIPHGVHPSAFHFPEDAKARAGLSKKKVLATFGFLSPGKGIEYVIESLPAIVKEHPDTEYWLIGRTHPLVQAQHGEQYRKSLIRLVKRLKLEKHVKFYSRYQSLPELLKFLAMTDIYVATSLDPDQTVSGTFSYALGSGRCIVSTKFAQAKELIVRKNMGILVDFRKPDEFSRAILTLLDNPRARKRMQLRAYEMTRGMLWPNCALSYQEECMRIAPSLEDRVRLLPSFSLDHLEKMTDRFGMIQFARGSEPEPSSGYTLDDNARAMLVCTERYRSTGDRSLLALARKYLNVVAFCQTGRGSFHNYIGEKRAIVDPPEGPHVDLDDANGRALWALGALIGQASLPLPLRDEARLLWKRFLTSGRVLKHARPKAFLLLGLTRVAAPARKQVRKNADDLTRRIREQADFLVARFQEHSLDRWQWFEPHLTYANGALPAALLEAFRATNVSEYREIGLRTLDFLLQNNFRGGIYVPVGQRGWHIRDKERSDFDQQPEEPLAMIQALASAYRVTLDDRFREKAWRVFYWFLGNNLLGLPIVEPATGACHDGLMEDGVNDNQGAESTLSYLIARELIEELLSAKKIKEEFPSRIFVTAP